MKIGQYSNKVMADSKICYLKRNRFETIAESVGRTVGQNSVIISRHSVLMRDKNVKQSEC